MLRQLVEQLEERYYTKAYGEEKAFILKLLSMYYPIIQKQIATKSELRQSKINFENVLIDCRHNELIRDKNMRFLFKCKECNRVIFKD